MPWASTRTTPAAQAAPDAAFGYYPNHDDDDWDYQPSAKRSRIGALGVRRDGHGYDCLEEELKFAKSQTASTAQGAQAAQPSSATVRKWWMEYMRSMAAAHESLNYKGKQTAMEKSAMKTAMVSAAACPKCIQVAFKEFKEFEITLAGAIAKTVSSVSLSRSDLLSPEY